MISHVILKCASLAAQCELIMVTVVSQATPLIRAKGLVTVHTAICLPHGPATNHWVRPALSINHKFSHISSLVHKFISSTYEVVCFESPSSVKVLGLH